jgi:hypothetical protein
LACGPRQRPPVRHSAGRLAGVGLLTSRLIYVL